MNKESIETHPCFPKDLPFNIENAKILILGTFPSKNAYEEGKPFFYYQSKNNEFWKIMDEILQIREKYNGKQLYLNDNIGFKKKVLIYHGISLVDIFKKIERKNNTSNDGDLVVKECWEGLINDVTNNKNIEKILVPLGVYSLLRKYYRKIQKEKEGGYNVGKKSEFYGKYILICPSFSPSSYRRSKIKDLKEKTDEFKKIFQRLKIID